jgi:hypothetical protein
MQDVMEAVFGGFINPGELSISRVISSDPAGLLDTDTAVYTGNLLDYSVDLLAVPGWVQVTDNRVPPFNIDGRDLVRNVERLRFADGLIVNPEQRPGGDANTPAQGQPTITGDDIVGGTLTASIDGVTDADNLNGLITSAVAWTWESELELGTGVFTPIIRDGVDGNGDEIGETSQTLLLTAADNFLRVRVQAIFQDDAGVFEVVTSEPVFVGGGDNLIFGDINCNNLPVRRTLRANDTVTGNLTAVGGLRARCILQGTVLGNVDNTGQGRVFMRGNSLVNGDVDLIGRRARLRGSVGTINGNIICSGPRSNTRFTGTHNGLVIGCGP